MTSTKTAISNWEQFKSVLEHTTADPVKRMIIEEKVLSYAQGLMEGNVSVKQRKKRKEGA